MPNIHVFGSQISYPGRTLAVGALLALALAGCGTDQPGGGSSQSRPGTSSGSKASATSPSADQAAFAAMLGRVAQPCPAPGGTPIVPKPTGPQQKETRLAPGETPPPPSEGMEPAAPTGPEAVLNARDWCASVQHEQRIIEALQGVSSPTAASVRKTLHSLGYIDEHIHGLKQEGKTTRFYLDLRESGGRLCEAGTASGETTEMFRCVARATGEFVVEEEADRPS